MNFKLVVFIIVDLIIILLLLIQLQYTMYIPQGYSRFQQMKTSILQHLNNAMSSSASNQSKKKLLRFKVKEAKTLNDRIAKYISKEPSSKDNNLEQEESDFHNYNTNNNKNDERSSSLWWSDQFLLHCSAGRAWCEEFYSSGLQPNQQIRVNIYDK